jgi:hypothetical protein
MVTSFPRTIEKVQEIATQVGERGEPGFEDGVTVRGQRVGALGRAGEVRPPLGDDEALVLEPAKRAVDVPDVDALLAEDRREPLEKLVAMGRAIREEHEQARLAKALHACAHRPGSVVETTTVA